MMTMDELRHEQGESAPSTFWLAQGELRTVWRLCIFFAFFIVAELVGAGILLLLGGAAGGAFLQLAIFHAGTAVATFLVYRLVERRPFSHVGLSLLPGWRRQLLLGCLVGGGGIAGIALMEWAGGGVRIVLFQQGGWQVLHSFADGLLLFAIVGFGEEILARGYCFQALVRGTNQWGAVVSSSMFFAVMHVFNPFFDAGAAMNILLAGIWFGIARIKTGQLWYPVGLHIGWNFVQGTIFGYPVSGVWNNSIFRATESGADWITGGMFGPEGGVLASLVILTGTAMHFHEPFLRFLTGTTRHDGVQNESHT